MGATLRATRMNALVVLQTEMNSGSDKPEVTD
jgi:hypothetical protein